MTETSGEKFLHINTGSVHQAFLPQVMSINQKAGSSIPSFLMCQSVQMDEKLNLKLFQMAGER